MIAIDITPKDFVKETQSFVLEISEHPEIITERNLILRNPITNNEVPFKFVAEDEDLGWKYESEDKKFNLFILNN